jgi:hypothetical protein
MQAKRRAAIPKGDWTRLKTQELEDFYDLLFSAAPLVSRANLLEHPVYKCLTKNDNFKSAIEKLPSTEGRQPKKIMLVAVVARGLVIYREAQDNLDWIPHAAKKDIKNTINYATKLRGLLPKAGFNSQEKNMQLSELLQELVAERAEYPSARQRRRDKHLPKREFIKWMGRWLFNLYGSFHNAAIVEFASIPCEEVTSADVAKALARMKALSRT